MSELAIINLLAWLETPPGRYLLDWERAQIDSAVADIFGYHALQLGLPVLDGLAANRMPHQWLASEALWGGLPEPARSVDLLTDYCALPFASSSLDLVLLPHTLDFSADPHATLREVQRVLVPEGRLVITGMNPTSLWGFKQGRDRVYRRIGFGAPFMPQATHMLGNWRLRDWLHLLSLEVEACTFGCYRPAMRSEQWLSRFGWMDRAGARWWPIFGSAYCMVAVKRVRGMRLLGPAWKAKPVRAGNPVSVANRVKEYAKRGKVHWMK